MAYQFEVDLANLNKELDKIASPAQIKKATERSCLLVQATAVQNLRKEPRWRTGTLAASIQTDIKGGGRDITGVVGTPLEYAPYVEYGTGKFAEKGGRDTPWAFPNPDGYYGEGEYITTEGQPPVHFLSNALDDNLRRIELIFKEEIGNV